MQINIIGLVYNFIPMSLSKKQIQDLQQVLTPQQRRFNILEVIEKYPDNPHMHETFREICLHYESASLSFKQIMAYLFGQFHSTSLNVNKNSGGNLDDNQAQKSNKSPSLRIKKNNATQKFKVVLLNGQNQRIMSIIMDGDNLSNCEEEMFVVTNNMVREFNMRKQCYGQQVLQLSEQIIAKAAIHGSLIGLINKANEFHVQVLPRKLEQLQRKQTKKQRKCQISRVLVKKLPKLTKIVALLALSQEEWLIFMPQKLLLLSLELSQSDAFSYKQTKMKINEKNSDMAIESACKLSGSFVGMISNDCSLIIVNTTNMSVTHTMGNDTNFVAMCFNPDLGLIVASDFGGYLMSLTFNGRFGDIEEQGMAKRESDQLKLPETELMETHYLGKSVKHASAEMNNKKGKVVLQEVPNKEARTQFTTIVQNTSRTPLELLHTKKKSVFSYESKYGCFVKIWDIHTLQAYQKVALNMEIYELKASSLGLYLISREKGYLCYFGLESNADDLAAQGRRQAQVIDLSISSNVVFIKTATMGEIVVYKLKLFNKPVIAEYSSKSGKNAQKSLKYCFYKNEMYLLDCSKHHSSVLETYGVFGEAKESIVDLKEYHSMTAYPDKQGVVLWSSHRFHIRCKTACIPSIVEKKFVRGQHILSNFNDNQPPNSMTDKMQYSHTVLFHEQISKIKCFKQYVTAICNPIDGISNCYVIDESAMSIVLQFSLNAYNHRILECHKRCTLFMRKAKTNGNKPYLNNSAVNALNNASEITKTDYFLFCNRSGDTLWQSEDIPGWAIEAVNIISVEANAVELACTYKSSTPLTSENAGDKPIFYLVKYAIAVESQQKTFINLCSGTRPASSENQTLQDMLSRSIFQKYDAAAISNSKHTNRVTEKTNYKVFYNPTPMNNSDQRSATKLVDDEKHNLLDIKSTTAKILHYQKEENVILFAAYGQSTVMLFQLEKDNTAECIGVLDFDLIEQEKSNNNLKSCIRYWNQNYKKDDQDLWQEAKSRAIRRAKNNSRTPQPFIFLRSDSLRETNKKWNPENLEQTLVVPDIKKRSFTQKKILAADPFQINQLLHKHNIHQSIIKQKQKTKKSRQPKQQTQPPVDIEGIRALTSTVRLTKQSLFTDSVSISLKTKTESMRKLKTQQSMDTKLSRDSEVKITPKRRLRYGTEAEQQLQKSKIIEQTLLPSLITTRNDSVKVQTQKKAHIYDLLKRQQFSLQQSRCIQSRIQRT